MIEEIKVLELFGGIGACSKAFEKLNIPHKVVDYVEIDENAVKSYNAVHGSSFIPQDITKWDKDIDVDFLMHGSPCQDFSAAGKQKGGDEGSGTRSSLMYETIRIVKKLRPRYVLWENVANLLSEKHSHNFYRYIKEMKSIGYDNSFEILNSADYGLPQGRDRIFVVSILNGKKFDFPLKQKLTKTFYDYLDESDIDESVILTKNDISKMKDFGAPYAFGGSVVKGGIYPTITASYGKVSGNSGKIPYKDTYRILTAKECWRLMGFDDEDYEKAAQVCLKSHLYHQAGNSIVVNVIEAIVARLFNIKLDIELVTTKRIKKLF